jgi:hypothetical protein
VKKSGVGSKKSNRGEKNCTRRKKTVIGEKKEGRKKNSKGFDSARHNNSRDNLKVILDESKDNRKNFADLSC